VSKYIYTQRTIKQKVTSALRYVCLFSPLGKLAGLYILLALISSFFFTFLLSATLSQYLLGRFSRSFHQMEGICVSFLDQIQFFQFLKGRCHGNQFCVVSQTQTMCNFCNFYQTVMGIDDRFEFFSISQGTLPWQTILFRTRLVHWEPKYFRIR